MKRSLASVLLVAALLCLAVPAGAAASAPPFFTSFPEDRSSGEAAGQLRFPLGIAVQPGLPGNLYVADRGNNRIDEFSPWGEFVRAWGWRVNAEAPEERLQSCTTETGCQRGAAGGGTGQFDFPESVALDPAGNVYVVDEENPRVQKFDPEGHFLSMFGYRVNKSAEEEGRASEEDVCPAPGHPGDVCRAGTAGPGPGQITSYFSTGRLAIDSAGAVFLADGKRIERFSAAGAYEEEIDEMPYEVDSIALDAKGKLYASFEGGGDYVPGISNVIRKLEPTGPTASFLEPEFEADGSVFPSKLALDPAGHLYVTVFPPNPQPRLVLELDPAGNCLVCGAEGEGGQEGFDRSEGSQLEGIATGAACGPTDVYVSHFDTGAGSSGSYLKIFGPHPDTATCPPPKRPPTIEASYAASVDASDAELRADINPHFWADTTYYLEYGAAPCTEGGCATVPAPPGRLLSGEVTGEARTAAVSLQGLEPATTYHYRFVAQGSGSEGQEVRGTGGAPGADGVEGTFTTFATQAASGCPNDPFRLGPGAYLPDCRAYELVSPLDKNNGDVVPTEAATTGEQHLPAGLEQSSASGNRLAYSSATAFADAVSAPYTSQYIAQRIAGSEWQTHAISPPRGRILEREEFVALVGRDTDFKLFSPDLCQAWLRSPTDAPLDPGREVAGSFNLYRRTDRLCAPGGADRYEALTTVAPSDGHLGIDLELQGVSADGQTSIYASPKPLTAEARAVGTELRCLPGTDAPPAVGYRWLRNGEPIAGAESPAYATVLADAGKAIQCQVTAIEEKEGREAGATRTSGPFVVSPDPASAPPRALAQIAAPAADAPLQVGGAGGQRLGCDPAQAEWQGSPSFAFQWYRNGEEIPGATAPTYTATAADLATAAAFQCAVLAGNAGGSVVALSAGRLTDPAPSNPGAPDLKPRMSFADQLYARGAGGRTRLACVLPAGATVSCLAGTTVSANIRGYWASLDGALSADGRRVLWSTPALNGGAIYERENPLEPPSAQAHGSATGTGRLKEGETEVPLQFAARGKANLKAGSTTAELIEVSIGEFVAGQPLSGAGIAAGTTVEAIEGATLALSAPATQDRTGSTISSKGPQPFAVEQTIVGKGIPAGTRIEAIEGTTLVLSKAATVDESGVPLEAFSECTEAARACTVPVSAAGEALSGAGSSRFLAASPDGSKVLYLAKGGEGGASDLYEFDLASEATHRIAGAVPGIMGTSEDLAKVYLLSREDCDAAGEGEEGAYNLYLYEAGESCAAGDLKFIAPLAAADARSDERALSAASPVSLAPARHSARVSADGSHLAFASVGRPTGYDNTGQQTGQRLAEVYLYDAAANGGQGKLLCASCNPSGARPTGGRLENGRWDAANLPGWENSFYPSRALSEDGNRLFFTSTDALSPRDTNGVADVYEWEAPGAGGPHGCHTGDPDYSPRNGGCVSLISSGASPRDSEFRDASPDGHDVFFATLSSLLPQDYGLVDIYDARVEGGLPIPQPNPSSCEGEACQSPPAAPNDPTPASASFQGAGNQSPAADCGAPARRAARLSHRARRLRRSARRLAAHRDPRKARRVRSRARRLAREARGQSARAKRCRLHRKRGAAR
jgi:DNA-binding beta-propeller fold protein YncE